MRTIIVELKDNNLSLNNSPFAGHKTLQKHLKWEPLTNYTFSRTSGRSLKDFLSYISPATTLPLNIVAVLLDLLAIASAEQEASTKTMFASSPTLGQI